MRFKAKCTRCGKTILLFFHENDPDIGIIEQLKKGEHLEHKCPGCEEWTAFECLD